MSGSSKKASGKAKQQKKKAVQGKRKVGKASAARKRVSRREVAVTEVNPQQRLQMIREAAYFRAASRGFQGGSAEQDWLEAEAQIDRQLQGGNKN